MNLEDQLTRPERACQINQAKRVRERIVAAGGCPYCTKRDPDEGWGRAVCGLRPQQKFPACVASNTFRFDEAA